MNKKLSYIVTIILSLFAGSALMYMLIYYFPNSIVKTESKIQKVVKVNEEGISSGIDNIYDSVVVVENYKKGKLSGIGSGFIYAEDGYIMTNHHVIESSDEIKITLTNGESLEAKVLGSDELADIAVLQIDKKYAKNIAKIGKSSEAKVGDTVFTIGSPMSSEFSGTVTRGILSGKNRMVEVSVGSSSSKDWIMNVMQTDAAINPGNSGGPLCNVSGEVIGINSMKIVQSEIEGIGFSIPIEDALLYANKIVKGEKIQRPFLGVQMADMSTSGYYLAKQGIKIDNSVTSGVIVISTADNGPSNKAGLEKGDVIIGIEKYKVKSVAELRYYLYKYEPNDEVEIKAVVNLSIIAFARKQCKAITDMHVSEIDYEKMNQMAGIIGYMVQEEDTLWNIAKQYYSSIDSIRKVNQLERDELTPGQKLIIVKG